MRILDWLEQHPLVSRAIVEFIFTIGKLVKGALGGLNDYGEADEPPEAEEE